MRGAAGRALSTRCCPADRGPGNAVAKVSTRGGLHVGPGPFPPIPLLSLFHLSARSADVATMRASYSEHDPTRATTAYRPTASSSEGPRPSTAGNSWALRCGRAPRGRRAVSRRANRRWWDADAADYQAEHGRSSATPTSSGARRACARRTPGCSATSRGRRVLEVGADRRRARAGWPARGRRWRSTSRAGMLRHARPRDRRDRHRRAAGAGRRAGLPFADGTSTSPSPRSARCRSSPTRPR